METENERCTPIELMAALLADMTARADKAERERDAAKKDSDKWYNAYMSMKERAEEAEEMRDAAIAGNETLCEALENAAKAKCPEDCPGKKGEA